MAEVICRQLETPTRPALTDFACRNIHLIGIGGCGLSGAASVLMQRGARITGSDELESSAVQKLSAAGATIFIGHEHDNLPHDVDLVVASAAIPHTNPELLAARARGRPILKYSQLLGEIMRLSTGVAVAGTHGKSTTTAMAAFLARRSGIDASFIVGAEVPQLGGGSGVGTHEAFIVEACEYDRSFLNLAPKCGVILNIEEDHLDYFTDLRDIVDAFRDFAELVPPEGTLIFNHDDPTAHDAAASCRAQRVTFGLGAGATWRAANVTLSEGLPEFDICCHDRPVGRARLALPGRHNVHNALAACAVTHVLGGNIRSILNALPEFAGADRRLTYRGRIRDIDILDDYAHHPTEIRATLRGVRERYTARRLRVVFQPHQVSRTRFFLDDFASSFGLADEIIVPDIYFVRDSQAERHLVSSRDLVARIVERGGSARYIAALPDIAAYLAQTAEAGDLVLTMGAGDVWKVANDMVSRLGAHH